MTQLLVRNLPMGVKERLRAQARAKGRSLEAEVREVLTLASVDVVASGQEGPTLSQRIRKIWTDAGLTDEEHRTIFERRPEDWVWRRSVDFSGPEWDHLDDPEPVA